MTSQQSGPPAMARSFKVEVTGFDPGWLAAATPASTRNPESGMKDIRLVPAETELGKRPDPLPQRFARAALPTPKMWGSENRCQLV